ncbi:MAG: hypothetical protein H6Q11_1562, partial [Acidobacteria bacterium]|nr:hypothetical protein [Acidobacteriota bacterium]
MKAQGFVHLGHEAGRNAADRLH